eukprot:Gregarina_sp_Poly_1__9127@NODE_55_length_17436_cov_154_331798_g47_i0_p14_GENE_NODE_55_length_17436_cov_154_331798_g47_i0NODE_55_length_17436_cov_154_331798_g47_i0_p14_ORF_typecomplete_len152_score11_05_NODE_55_length_17436_cov_154_331798_g47_i01503915494
MRHLCHAWELFDCIIGKSNPIESRRIHLFNFLCRLLQYARKPVVFRIHHDLPSAMIVEDQNSNVLVASVKGGAVQWFQRMTAGELNALRIPDSRVVCFDVSKNQVCFAFYEPCDREAGFLRSPRWWVWWILHSAFWPNWQTAAAVRHLFTG